MSGWQTALLYFVYCYLYNVI